MRLILFDIDNTLLYTGGAGVAAMNLAFREMFGGVDDGFGKANTSGRTDLYILSEMVRLGIERFADGVSPGDILIIGDTPHDVSSALDNGLGAVGVATGNYTVDQLRDSGAQMVFQDFANWQGAAAKLAGEA